MNLTFDTYASLIDYFKKIDYNTLEEEYLYLENHHIIPRSEGGKDEDGMVYLPIRYHVTAHHLRGKEWESKGNLLFAWKNYNAVIRCLGQTCLCKNELDFQKKLDDYVQAKSAWMRLNKDLGSEFYTDGKENRRILKPFIQEFLKENPNFRRGVTKPSNKLEKKWVTDGVKNTYVANYEQFLKENPSWRLGMAPTKKHEFRNETGKMLPTTLGKKWMNKDGVRKNVSPEEIQNHINDGWSIGHGSSTNTGLIPITNKSTLKNKRVKEDKLKEFLDKGWILGQSYPNQEISSNKGRIAIYKGGDKKKVHNDVLNEYLLDGWKLGRGIGKNA